jgi:exosortase
MRSREFQVHFFYFVFFSSVLILYFPVFVWLVLSWVTNPYYSHGFFIPFISGFLIWRIWVTEKKEFKPCFNLPGFILLVAGLLMFTGGYLYASFWICALSLIPFLQGVLILIFGWENSLQFLFPVLFLIFMIPVPFIDNISTYFAAFSAYWASALTHICGIPVTINGAEIFISDSSFRIGLPCSGLKTLISLLIPSTLLIFMYECNIRDKILLFVLIFPLALFTNVARIFFLVIYSQVYDPEPGLKTVHDILGIMMPVLVFLGILAMAHLIGCSSIKKGIITLR